MINQALREYIERSEEPLEAILRRVSSAAVSGAESVVATDARLREAAKRAGFKLIPPENR